MKYLVACLGNIGAEYMDTRHNIGFKVADAIAVENSVVFSAERYGSIAEIKYKGRCIILLKPSTYMNLSGTAVNYWLQKKKIPLENLLVVLDDIAIPFCSLRLKNKGSDGGHNALKNINEVLGHNNYARLRMGIGNSFLKGMQVDYVLGKWTREEQDTLNLFCLNAYDAICSFVFHGIQHTMNIVNKHAKKNENR
ncbi:MAG: aminoacyl-tRNA hydrolase [Bacteroidales bacterium]